MISAPYWAASNLNGRVPYQTKRLKTQKQKWNDLSVGISKNGCLVLREVKEVELTTRTIGARTSLLRYSMFVVWVWQILCSHVALSKIDKESKMQILRIQREFFFCGMGRFGFRRETLFLFPRKTPVVSASLDYNCW